MEFVYFWEFLYRDKLYSSFGCFSMKNVKMFVEIVVRSNIISLSILEKIFCCRKKCTCTYTRENRMNEKIKQTHFNTVHCLTVLL